MSLLVCRGHTWDWWLAGSEETELELYITGVPGAPGVLPRLTMAAVTLSPAIVLQIRQWEFIADGLFGWYDWTFGIWHLNLPFDVWHRIPKNLWVSKSNQILLNIRHIALVHCTLGLMSTQCLGGAKRFTCQKRICQVTWFWLVTALVLVIVMKFDPTFNSNRISQGHSALSTQPWFCHLWKFIRFRPIVLSSWDIWNEVVSVGLVFLQHSLGRCRVVNTRLPLVIVKSEAHFISLAGPVTL